MNSQFNKGVVELCVLALVKERDRYGYELVELISKKIEISEGTIYPILRRLTQEEFFDTYLAESSEGPPRKYYRITNKGRTHCQESIKEWNRFNKSVNEILKENT